jgi:hypothetical protein
VLPRSRRSLYDTCEGGGDEEKYGDHDEKRRGGKSKGKGSGGERSYWKGDARRQLICVEGRDAASIPGIASAGTRAVPSCRVCMVLLLLLLRCMPPPLFGPVLQSHVL